MSILTKILLDGLGDWHLQQLFMKLEKESVPTLKASENIRRQPSESDDGKADCRTGHR